MPNTIANVLTGTVVVAVREPNDRRAQWSTVQQQAGVQSVLLYKAGSGGDGSTHFQMVPPTGITLTNWTTGIAASTYSFYHWLQALTANFIQMEFRFEDPNSDGWVEITWMGQQTLLGTAAWLQATLLDADTGGYGGVGETGLSFFNFGPLTLMSAMEAAINGEGVVTSASDWILERVRLELWDANPERTCYVDTIEINGVTYTIEPGGTAPAMSLDSGYTDVGYTDDGATLTYTADEADIDVEEETFSIDRVLTKETAEITANLAERTLRNMNNAMAGAVLVGNILTLGGGVNKTMNLRISGINEDGFFTQWFFPKATATGAVGMPFKKGEKTVIPVTWQALKPQNEPAVTIVNNAA